MTNHRFCYPRVIEIVDPKSIRATTPIRAEAEPAAAAQPRRPQPALANRLAPAGRLQLHR
jgi:hypothetical protein